MEGIVLGVALMVSSDWMKRLFLILILIVMASACAKRARVAVPADGVMVAAVGAAADGQASYYGDPYHGRRTANGETFDKNKMTAAHRTLAFGTWVRVENQQNGKSVDVRINDRGPFVAGRIIDLSEGAARKIEMIRAGVVPVRLEIIRESRTSSPAQSPIEDVFYVVQLGAFQSENAAQEMRRRLEGKYTGIYVERPSNDSPLYKVRIGRALLSDARYLQDLLDNEDEIDAIVVQMK